MLPAHAQEVPQHHEGMCPDQNGAEMEDTAFGEGLENAGGSGVGCQRSAGTEQKRGARSENQAHRRVEKARRLDTGVWCHRNWRRIRYPPRGVAEGLQLSGSPG